MSLICFTSNTIGSLCASWLYWMIKPSPTPHISTRSFFWSPLILIPCDSLCYYMTTLIKSRSIFPLRWSWRPRSAWRTRKTSTSTYTISAEKSWWERLTDTAADFFSVQCHQLAALTQNHEHCWLHLLESVYCSSLYYLIVLTKFPCTSWIVIIFLSLDVNAKLHLHSCSFPLFFFSLSGLLPSPRQCERIRVLSLLKDHRVQGHASRLRSPFVLQGSERS